jgi:hypothetical protein
LPEMWGDRVRRPAWIKKSGPFKCVSLANGKIMVTPTWPQYQPYTEEDGGGPGCLGRMALADDLEAFLNAPYEEKPA